MRHCVILASGTSLLLCSSFLTGCVRYHAKPLTPGQYQADFQSRTLQAPGLAAFVTANGGSGAGWPPASLTLADANLVAAYYSPDLAVSRAQLESAKAAVITAGGRPNPEIAGASGYETVPGHPVALHFDLGIPIETAGKRHYRVLAAQEQVGVASLELQEAEWNTYAKARDAWFEYASALEAAEIDRTEAMNRARAVTLLAQRLEVGEIAEPVVSQSRILASEAALATAAADQRTQTARADLAAALGLPLTAIQKIAPDAKEFTPPPPVESLRLSAVQQKGLLNRLDVRRVELEYAAAEAQLHLAIAQQYPDIRLDSTYDYQEAFHMFTFGPSLLIPVLNRNRGPIAEASAGRAATQARFEAIQDRAIGEMEHALAQYTGALRQYQEANEHWLALQEGQERRTQLAVQLGDDDQLTLTEARVETAVARRASSSALGNAWLAYAALENSVQAPLSKIRIVYADNLHAAARGVTP